MAVVKRILCERSRGMDLTSFINLRRLYYAPAGDRMEGKFPVGKESSERARGNKEKDSPRNGRKAAPPQEEIFGTNAEVHQ